jgi:thioredoxin 1
VSSAGGPGLVKHALNPPLPSPRRKGVEADMESLNENSFAEALVAYPGVVVDFWAAWCAPCHLISPVLEEIAREAPADLLVAKVNVDEQSALATRFDVRALPTVLFFKDGEVVDRVIGAVPKAEIVKRVQALRP